MSEIQKFRRSVGGRSDRPRADVTEKTCAHTRLAHGVTRPFLVPPQNFIRWLGLVIHSSRSSIISMSSPPDARSHLLGQMAVFYTSPRCQLPPGWTTFHRARRCINTTQLCSELPQFCSIFFYPSLLCPPPSDTPSVPPTNTCPKNKSKHPGIPNMTPLQRTTAGLPRASQVSRSSPKKPSTRKPTKDQQIAALQSQLHAAQELMSKVSSPPLHGH